MATSSKSTVINIDLKIPTGWEDLSDKQLRYVFALLSQGFTATEVKAYCLCRWAGLKVLHRYGNNGWACRHGKQEFAKRATSAAPRQSRTSSDCSRLARSFILTAEQVERATHALGWLDNVPTMPVRIARIGRHRAVPADFEGVPFETLIVCDNLYQGYLATKQDELLDELASHLYSSKFRVESLGFRDLLGRLDSFPLTLYTLHKLKEFQFFTGSHRSKVFSLVCSNTSFSQPRAQAVPLVLAQVLRFGYANQRVL